MLGEKDSPKKPNVSNHNNNNSGSKKKKKKKKRGGRNKKLSLEQTLAYKSVSEWVFPNSSITEDDDDDFGVVQWNHHNWKEKLVFEFHSHSNKSDGFLSPSKLVERANQNGVKVLALTDHDTLSGIAEAQEAALRFGMKIIPGVEISTIFSPRGGSGSEEPVHILAYYSMCGPARIEELDNVLSDIRNGRFLRAKSMVSKLNKLKLPIKWDHVTKIAGAGVAPGRVHVARALVEAGHVENLKQAFARYLYDGGPAYSTGSEPDAEEAVELICRTGGVAVLAHPWALKDPGAVIRRLAESGLHGVETYRSDGKLAVYSDLADEYGLVKLGGSDYHARGGANESDLGSVSLPISCVYEFLEVARPVWFKAMISILEIYLKDPSDANLQLIIKFGNTQFRKSISALATPNDLINHCLSTWFTKEERSNPELESIKLKLSCISVHHAGPEIHAGRT
ncbi:OLC1v1002608C1 [Oldenlandia corymbosa var. corymbosa]|uniref:OLC1v1002608C1 n=1 Tax=Oldenlandia corymbosa var. corymbosa TaxID=529605 RepID=A0AAV1D825_OLDCO|nr:OLC1v1002608C1 [Oldenlandia corymbosa var. corymbosa]